MKKNIAYLGILLIAITATWALKEQVQPDPKAILILTKGEAEALYDMVDNAAVPGQIRKPILQKIANAYSDAFAQKPEVKKDTTKPKKQ
jgi:hypothetical protein